VDEEGVIPVAAEYRNDGKEVGVKQKSQQSLSSSPNEIMVNMFLERVPLDRSLLKKKSHMLLQYSLRKSQDEDGLTEYELIDAAEDAAAVDAAAVDAAAAAANSDNASNSGNNNHGDGGGADVDPMAVSTVKSTIAKYLSQSTRGEYSIQSAARVVASVIQYSDNPQLDLRNLAVLVLYHSHVESVDVAELVYSTS
jgi:hypothetical protein